MNPLHQRTFNLLLIGIGAGIVILSFGVRWYVDSLEINRLARETTARNELNAQLSDIQSNISDLEHITATLVANNKAVANQLASEQAKRISAENARAAESAAARAQIVQLQQNLDAVKSPDLAAIITAWRPRVANIRCHWPLVNDRVVDSSGSGVLLTSGTAPTIFTNRHVITYQGVTADQCTIKFPDDPIASVIKEIDINPSQGTIDWGSITIRRPSPYVAALANGTTPRCTNRATVGSSVVILGYPAIGAQNDVTATEGIISGFEGNYYISSAKVEQGNSGGAAILAKENCYLGMPTFVDVGQLETLARILDQRSIGK